MKSRYNLLSPKLTLTLSAALLFLSLCYAWAALDYPMPTQELALRTAELEKGLPPGEIIERIDVRDALEGEESLSAPWGESCLFTRREDCFYAFYTSRTAGLFWDSSTLFPLTSGDPMPLAYLKHGGFRDGAWHDDGVTMFTAVAVSDPAAARVILTQGLWPGLNGPLTEQEYLEEYGVTVDCAESAPGSGIWLGQQRVPPPVGDTGGYAYSSVARVYAADGTLLHTSS